MEQTETTPPASVWGRHGTRTSRTTSFVDEEVPLLSTSHPRPELFVQHGLSWPYPGQKLVSCNSGINLFRHVKTHCWEWNTESASKNGSSDVLRCHSNIFQTFLCCQEAQISKLRWSHTIWEIHWCTGKALYPLDCMLSGLLPGTSFDRINMLLLKLLEFS